MGWASSSGSARRITGGVELLDGILTDLSEGDKAGDGGPVGALAMGGSAGSVRSDGAEASEGTMGSVGSAQVASGSLMVPMVLT